MELSRISAAKKTSVVFGQSNPNASSALNVEAKVQIEQQPKKDEFVNKNNTNKVLTGLGVAAAVVGGAVLIYNFVKRAKKPPRIIETPNGAINPSEIKDGVVNTVENIINGTKERITDSGRKILDEFVDGKKVKTTLHYLDGTVSNVTEFKDGKIFRGLFVDKYGTIEKIKNYKDGKIFNLVELDPRGNLGICKITEYSNGHPVKIIEIGEKTYTPLKITEYAYSEGKNAPINTAKYWNISPEDKKLSKIKNGDLKSLESADYMKIVNFDGRSGWGLGGGYDISLQQKVKTAMNEGDEAVVNLAKEHFGLTDKIIKAGKVSYDLSNPKLWDRYLGSGVKYENYKFLLS